MIYFNAVNNYLKKVTSTLPLTKTLYIIFYASILIRVIVFNFLPKTPSSLAPDEGTYADLVKYIAAGKNTVDYPGYGPGLYLTSRILILPALYLNYTGISPLDSLRIISSLFGALSSFILIIYLGYILQKNKSKLAINQRFRITLILFFTIFTFWPSRFLWSVVGLRESANEFLVICFFISLNLFLFHSKNSGIKYVYLSLCCVLIIFITSIRFQVAIVLFFSCWIILATGKLKNSDRLISLILLSCTWIPIQQIVNSQNNLSITELNISGNAANKILTLDTELKAEGNKLNAESTFKIVRCPEKLRNIETRVTSNLICTAYRAPLSIPTFLFRPFFGLDTYSFRTYTAALENLIWVIGVFFVISNYFLKRRIIYFEYLKPIVIFSILFVCAASTYEGNLGTAFRHKSLVLITLFSWITLILYNRSLNKKIEN